MARTSTCWLFALALAGCYRGLASDDGAAAGDDDSTTGPGGSGGSEGGASESGDDGTSPECVGMDASVAPMRRLTAVQYANTIEDLFDGVIAPSTAFPITQTYKSYSNNPLENVVSLPAAQDILEAAEDVAVQVIDEIDSVVTCDGTQDEACAAAFIDDFAMRAYRRPLDDDERSELLALYQSAAATDGFADGIGTVVAAVLQSGDFLYLVERGTGEIMPGIVALSDYEIAARLSYLVWNSMPDDALFQAAAAGELQTDEGIAAQVDRMLADTERSGAAIERFVREWTHYDGVPAYDKDATLFPQFTAELSASIDEELSRFVRGVLASDAPTVATLLTTSNTEIDAGLAALFGIDAPAAGQWQPVDLGAQRSGLLTRPALLAEHAHASTTGPIFRGELVRTQLLCQVLPPPPPDAMANTPEYPPDATERERTEILIHHMNCGACHSLMNPIGLGFEDYDPIGAWRDVDVDGSAVDNSGEIIGAPEATLNATFNGVPELQALLAGSDVVTACVANQFYQYTFGVTPDQVPACAIDPVAADFVASGGDLHELVVSLALSNAFRTRAVSP
jgi:hypothetical protein